MAISGDYRIDALLRGDSYRWNAGLAYGTAVVVPYTFLDTLPSYYANVPNWLITGVNDATYTHVSLDSAHRELVRQEFAILSAAVPGLRFFEVTDPNAAVISISAYTPGGAGAASVTSNGNGYVPNGADGEPGTDSRVSGDIWFRTTSEKFDLSATYMDYPVQPTWFADLALGEILHTIGFKHAGNYSGLGTGNDSPPYLPAAEDNSYNTRMSYYGDYAGPDPRPYDILAGNFLYGGEPGNNLWLLANDGNTMVQGSALNELIRPGAGNQTIDGGAGIDTAQYSSNLSGYTLTKTGSSYTVHANAGTDGTDTLVNVERLQFADMTVSLTVQANAATVASAQLQRLEELYVAFFNRVPDADGLSYWIDQFKGGLSVNQIAESFYSAGVQYASLTGFSATMSNEDFVNVVYRNVLGRTSGADAGGLAYWSAALANGSESHGSLVSTILDSAHSFKGDGTWGWVADLLDNKILVADRFAVDWGLNYNTPDASIAHGMAIAAAVTPTSTAAAIALIGITEGQISLG